MISFEDIFQEIKSKIVDLAKSEVKDFAKNAVDDTNEYLQQSKENLKRWTLLLTDGKINGNEFGYLVNSQFGLGEMKVLTNAGIAQITVDRFTNSVVHIVVDTVLSRILKV